MTLLYFGFEAPGAYLIPKRSEEAASGFPPATTLLFQFTCSCMGSNTSV